ncbi:MAG: PfkB family carbohydrate kinase [Solirubrobacteraceae bacterium]
MERAIDYLAVGHVTIDVILDAPGGPLRQPGGGAFYSALQAAHLGLRARVLSAGVPRELDPLLDPYRDLLDVVIAPAQATTTLATCGSGSERRQRLLAWAGVVPAPTCPLSAEVLHLAPVARELAGRYPIDARLSVLTPQGLLRDWERLGGELRPAAPQTTQLPPLDAVALNETERERSEPLLSGFGQPPPIVAITAGAAAATLRLPDGTIARVQPARLQAVRDDLGAGDVFAAAFFVALARGWKPERAAAFGHTAAAVRLAGVGPTAIGDEAAIAALLARFGR